MTGRPGSTVRRVVTQVALGGEGAGARERRDVLAAEEPLEIRVLPEEALDRGRIPPGAATRVAVTMRTPGADFELAAGFLFAEGIVDGAEAIRAIRYCEDGERRWNVVTAVLSRGTAFDPGSIQRNFYATSSCGVCGKASIEAALGAACAPVGGAATVDAATLVALPEKLRGGQAIFDRTGGLHGAALFGVDGALLRVREDVGRHNAMDKLIGAALLAGELPLTDRVVLASGRLSFELAQKAARAGTSLLAGVSAPSSLAVETAEAAGMTLVGFLRERRFVVYAGAERIALAPAES